MNKNQKTIAAASAVVVTLAAVTTAAGFHAAHKDLYERFPEIDHKIVRKAYRRIMWNSLNQQYSDEMLADTNRMDALFLQTVQDLTKE